MRQARDAGKAGYRSSRVASNVFSLVRIVRSLSVGIGVQIASESPFTLRRNRCSVSFGIGVRFAPEYACRY